MQKQNYYTFTPNRNYEFKLYENVSKYDLSKKRLIWILD
jgi:hypothetical protein